VKSRGVLGRPEHLLGRADERRLIESLLHDAKGGQSRVLVIRGDPGVGKTALLDHAIGSAAGFQVARASGVESEMELAFAGLHQLCAPMLDRLALLPRPQRGAMSTAFGLADGPPPDRFLIGLAALSLLSEAAEQAPLLCVVDDAHWLDKSSADALTFVARRLFADRVCLLFGTRQLIEDMRGLSGLVLEGLGASDARALLASVLRAPLDARVRERILAESHGNPLALLEWSSGLAPAELAGGFGLPALPMAGRIEESFRRRLGELPPTTQRFLTVAAAEPTGDPALVWRAAGRIGITTEDASLATEAGLIEIGARMGFRHPLVRSAAYAAASLDDRRAAHRALAEATDAMADPVIRAWHLVLAAAGPDEEVAEELEGSARRAQARGGLAAAAALLERSAALTIDPARRTQRTIAAARAHLEAGAPDASEALLAVAEAGPLDELSRANVEILRGQSAITWGDSGDAVRLLVRAAKRLESVDIRRARDTYTSALAIAVHAGSQSSEAARDETARAARAVPTPPGPPRPHDLLLDGLALVVTAGWASAAPALRRAITGFADAELAAEKGMFWFGHACAAAVLSWDWESFLLFSTRRVEGAREVGALAMLPWALDSLAVANVFGGDLAAAASLVGEAEALVEATGGTFTVYSAAQLAAARGHQTMAEAAIGVTIKNATARGQGVAVKIAQAAGATLYNGLGRYDVALGFAREANGEPLHWSSQLSLHELVEAAARSGQTHLAGEALDRLSESAQASGTDWALGTEARCRALLSRGDAAEASYREAIERLDRSPIRPEAARARLLYGEWLRRENRRVDARRHLRAAYERLSAIGMEAFAERARHELAATGETVRKRTFDTFDELTPQELHIARLAADGRTNAQIGSQLFISARTVEWHLRKVFTKLDVTSRGDLRDALPRLGIVSAT
jgi:DNA-binding CsgD family transcriptional regulator